MKNEEPKKNLQIDIKLGSAFANFKKTQSSHKLWNYDKKLPIFKDSTKKARKKVKPNSRV
jgi:hypothetical protein